MRKKKKFKPSKGRKRSFKEILDQYLDPEKFEKFVKPSCINKKELRIQRWIKQMLLENKELRGLLLKREKTDEEKKYIKLFREFLILFAQ